MKVNLDVLLDKVKQAQSDRYIGHEMVPAYMLDKETIEGLIKYLEAQIGGYGINIYRGTDG